MGIGRSYASRVIGYETLSLIAVFLIVTEKGDCKVIFKLWSESQDLNP
jgi:hypothetical protein